MNGIFTSSEKTGKYGNKWKAYDDAGQDTDYFFILLGSNDVSDANCRFVDIKSRYSADEYIQKVELEMAEWLESLKPHIRDLVKAIDSRSNNARILYMPILQRKSWLIESRRLALRLDDYVVRTIPEETNIPIKIVPTKSLLYRNDDSGMFNDVTDDVITPFLKDDGVHLSLSGYEALINDFTCVVTGLWALKVGGRMWSQKAIDRKKYFCRLYASTC